MYFTDRGIAALKSATRKVVYEDGAHGQGSFGVRVSPNGGKSWLFSYTLNGTVRHMTLGRYPQMCLAEAREAATKAARERAEGLDPAVKTVQAKRQERTALTVKELGEEYLEKYARVKKKSADRDEAVLKREIYPIWGPHKASAIGKRDVIALIDGIANRPAPIAANRALALVRKLFNWAVARDELERNPCQGVQMPGKENQRDRVLTLDELKTMLGQLPTASMSDEAKLAVQFQLLTAQRCGEVTGALWSEIDTKAGWWTIPAARAKNKKSHRVPLSPQALAVLEAAEKLSPGQSAVFPSPRGDTPMVETAVSRAVHRNEAHFKIAPFSPHDLRRTAASHMTGARIPRLVVQKLLNHADKGVTAVYDRHSYDEEKREALVLWGSMVAALAAGGAGGV